MKKFLFSIFLLSGVIVCAQEIPTSTPRTIEPVPSGTNTSGSMLFPNTTEKKKYVRPSEKPTIDLTQSTDLLDPGVRFQNQRFKNDIPPVDFINDTFLGELRTKSKFLDLQFWDPGAQDGDRVRIWLNDKIIFQDMILSHEIQDLEIMLQEGFNKLEVEALNQGSMAPNTSGITVKEEDGTKIHQKLALFNPGVRSLLIIIKE